MSTPQLKLADWWAQLGLGFRVNLPVFIPYIHVLY